jgi:two-component system, sensor histidine kinase YesM
MKTKRLSVLSRLLLLFLTILLPLFSAGALGVHQANRKLERQILQSMQENTERFAQVTDSQLFEITKAVLFILAQGRVAKLERVNTADADYETYYNINVMREFMSNVQSTYPIISNIRVYLPAMEKAYNSNGYAKGSLQDLSAEAYHELVEVKRAGGMLLYHGGRLMSLQALVSSYPRSLIEVEFNLSRFSDFLASSLLYHGSYYYFCLPDQMFTLSNLPDGMQTEFTSLRSQQDAFPDQIRFKDDAGNPYAVFHAPMPLMNGTYVQFIPRRMLLQPSTLSTGFLIILLSFLMVGILLFIGGAIRLIHNPLKTLIKAFKALGEDRQFGITVPQAESPDFSYLYSAFNQMSAQLYQLICHDYSQRMLLQEANFKQLQAQINPHFLYNSFFLLHRMIKSGQHEESKLVAKELGSYFQFITKRQSETVTLSDEYEHARIYSSIQTIRFGERIQVIFHALPVGYESLSVPKLILQPLVENAFNYGLENKVDKGILLIRFEPISSGLNIYVEENGDDLTEERIHDIQACFSASDEEHLAADWGALMNIRKRLQIHYHQEDVLTVSRSSLGGMCVRISVFRSER